ncbi:MAG: ATP-dependent Clp protease proteolytic subunit [Clostridia bacterium]|nr:ATP-dependent Clp protease proteolytic subunit [Clostridia bacterium]
MLNQIERDRTFGQASDIELETEHLMAGKKRMNSLFAALWDRSDDEIALNMERKYWLFADRAKEYGLIDQVIG